MGGGWVNKFSAKKETVDGIVFASRAEARRYGELKMLMAAKVICGLELQPRFDIVINGQKVCTYIADFRYTENGKEIVEDVKGCKKGSAYSMFRIKKKLVKACYGVDVKEV